MLRRRRRLLLLIEMGDHDAAPERRISWSGEVGAYCGQESPLWPKSRTKSEGDCSRTTAAAATTRRATTKVCTAEEVEEEPRYDECVIHGEFTWASLHSSVEMPARSFVSMKPSTVDHM